MIIAGDVGGTNVRLACFDQMSKRDPLCIAKYKSRDFADFSSLLKQFMQTLGGKKINAACFGIAGPIQNGRCQATNLPWVIDAKKLEQETAIAKVWLMNDLEANAWGLSVLRPEELCVLNPGMEQKANAALISAGTGLGEAGLFWDGKTHTPFACEGGHADFAPTNEEEVELWRYLKGKFEHVSYERVLSGSGIFEIYQFLINTKKEAPEPGIEEEKEPQKIITEKALKKQSAVCRRTLELFCSIYGREAGNLALKMLATSGVYVGGGIAPRIIDLLQQGQFMKAFTAKGRFFSLLSQTPVKVILNDQTALLGAARYAEEKG